MEQYNLSSSTWRTINIHPLFNGVFGTEQDFNSAAIADGYAECSFAPGESIHFGHTRWIGLLLQGSARVYSNDNNRQVLLRPLVAGDIVGIAQLFAGSTAPMSRIIARSKVSFLVLNEAAVRRLLDRSTIFRDNCLAYLADRVAFLNHKIACFTAGSAERRLALYLCTMSRDSDRFTCTTSLSAMADALDISRASLYRALDTLEADGFLIRREKQFCLCNRDQMLTRYQ